MAMTTTARRRGARVARFELPGVRWYIAICEQCHWMDMSWRDKGWAKDAVKDHNDRTEH